MKIEELSSEEKRTIKHFSHRKHLLTFLDEGEVSGQSLLCSWCSLSIGDDETAYGCIECKFFLHEQCSQLPKTVYHPVHPDHPLDAIRRRTKKVYCTICSYEVSQMYYRCRQQCRFNIHASCASLTPSMDYQGFHQHALILLPGYRESVSCKHCHSGSPGLDKAFYRCVQCNWSYHYTCGGGPQLPATFKHKYHLHQLSFNKCVPKDEIFWDEYYCDACENERDPTVPVYYCAECKFIAHVSCVFAEIVPSKESEWSFFYGVLLSTPEYSDWILPVSSDGNWSSFFQAVRDRKFLSNDSILASGVVSTTIQRRTTMVQSSSLNGEKEKSGQDNAETPHGSVECEFLLDEQYFHQLPRKIYHPVHPDHPLTTCRKASNNAYCNICSYKIKQVYYHCKQCRFRIHVGCASLMPSMDYEGFHQHPLILLPNYRQSVRCRHCSGNAGMDKAFYHCVQCNWSYHYICGGGPRLPATVENQNHLHPLSFTKYAPEDDIYCNVCGKERDLRIPIYYCAECKFIAHVSCVFTEIVPSPEAEWSFFYATLLSTAEYSDWIIPPSDGNWSSFFYAVQHRQVPSNTPILANEVSDMIIRKSAVKVEGISSDEKEAQGEEEDEEEGNTTKNATEVNNHDTIHGSIECESFLREQCRQLPRTICHPVHPEHPLTACRKLSNNVYCEICSYKVRRAYYRCRQCRFNIHAGCASIVPSMNYEGFHKHALTLLPNYRKSVECDYCGSGSTGSDKAFYLCVECDLSYHYKCGGGPRLEATVQHKDHLHPLYFTKCLPGDDGFKCDACGEKRDPTIPVYYCAEPECKFVIHVSCVFPEIVPTREAEWSFFYGILLSTSKYSDWIMPTSSKGNWSPFFQAVRDRNESIIASGIASMIFRKEVGEGTQEEEEMMYSSSDEEDEDLANRRIQFPGHQHHLTFFDEETTKETIEECSMMDCCYWCNIFILAASTTSYGCIKCEKFILHEQCFKLPIKIHHPSHPHPLAFDHLKHSCNACGDSPGSLLYGCRECEFWLDSKCAPLVPSIASKCHPKHPLTLLSCSMKDASCEICHESSPRPTLFCAKCDMSFHYDCAGGPKLPDKIKHKDHYHLLSFRRFLVEEEYDMFYCDVCEEERHPDVPVYYCAQCQYISHVSCVIPEIVPSPEAEWSFFHGVLWNMYMHTDGDSKDSTFQLENVLPSSEEKWFSFFQVVYGLTRGVDISDMELLIYNSGMNREISGKASAEKGIEQNEAKR